MTDPRFDAMAEAAARALRALQLGRDEWDALDEPSRDIWRYLARACLTAALAAVPGLVVTEVPGETRVPRVGASPTGYKMQDRGYAFGYNDCRAAVLAKAVKP